MMRGLFIAGTDTDVGKTWIASLIVRQAIQQGVPTGAYKPACSGSVDGKWHDIECLAVALGGQFPRERICPQRFGASLAPPVAARLEDKEVDEGLLVTGADWWRSQSDLLVVEGAGGLLSPIGKSTTNADLGAKLQFPLIIVARAGLGTINHSLLTIEAARNRGLLVAGLILNDVARDTPDLLLRSNASEIAKRGDVFVIGSCAWNSAELLDHRSNSIAPDWLSLAACAE